jgi:16S rRNA C1402 (ribose-2'-O) methylase RsmI
LRYQIQDTLQNNIFRKNIVFGSLPIGDPADISLSAIEHIKTADVILVENHRQFSRLINAINYLNIEERPNINPRGVILQYNLESDPAHVDDMKNVLLEHVKNRKKIFAVSDEGSSVFLEPMSQFKSMLSEMSIPYQVLSGPNSVISAVVNGKRNVHSFYFAGNFQHLADKKKTFEEIRLLNKPTVIILKSKGLEEVIKELSDNFSNDWEADFQMNLSMDTEIHVDGVFDKILEFVYTNSRLWSEEDEIQKVIITLYPKGYHAE